MVSGRNGDSMTSADRPPASRVESAADRALAERPSVSIRLRIGVIMALSFLLTAGITVAWVVSVQELGASQQLLERVNRYVFELEQARRFEKNYLLYQTNLDDAVAHVEAAHRLLASTRDDVDEHEGAVTYAQVEGNLKKYESALEGLSAASGSRNARGPEDRAALEHDLRRTGARAVEDASALMDSERLRMHTLVRSSKIAALAGLIVVLMVLSLLASNLARQILQPLGRFVTYTQRIAGGDYSPILPVRRFKDEFSDLALAINRMLSQIKDHQEQLTRTSRMAAVGTLTAGVAHELNNPLNNISLTAEAILEGYDDYTKEEKVKMLADIFTQVERASATVHNLLDFTRVERPVFVPVSLHKTVSECARLVANEARIANIEFDLDVAEELPDIRGNPRDLQQIFLNLFLNAIQAMPQGGTIRARSHVASPCEVRIEVTDTGIGIPEEHLESIFDPFFTTKEVGVGTGLGLAVTYGIVQKHHGRLVVESEVGEGTTFTLYLPCATEAPGDAPAS